MLDSSFAFDETSAHSEENLMKKRAFRVALAEIPYDLGLKTTKDNVIVDFKRQKDGTVRVRSGNLTRTRMPLRSDKH